MSAVSEVKCLFGYSYGVQGVLAMSLPMSPLTSQQLVCNVQLNGRIPVAMSTWTLSRRWKNPLSPLYLYIYISDLFFIPYPREGFEHGRAGLLRATRGLRGGHRAEGAEGLRYRSPVQ